MVLAFIFFSPDRKTKDKIDKSPGFYFTEMHEVRASGWIAVRAYAKNRRTERCQWGSVLSVAFFAVAFSA
jgi:hypothetical protein